MKHYLEKIYKIMIKARTLAEADRWEDLEDFADSKLEEVISLADKALSSISGAKEQFGEELRWEFFSTLTGSHYIDAEIGRHRLKMDLNLSGEAPILELS